MILVFGLFGAGSCFAHAEETLACKVVFVFVVSMIIVAYKKVDNGCKVTIKNKTTRITALFLIDWRLI